MHHYFFSGLDKRTLKWKKMDAEDACPDFPRLSEDEIRQLTIGVYQLKLAKSYTHEHLDMDGSYSILVNDDIPGIVSAKIQSRHTSAKQY